MGYLPNKRMPFADQVDTIVFLYRQMMGKYSVTVVVEDVGYQRALIQTLEERGCRVTAFKVGNVDKRSRLTMVSPRIRDGNVLFPTTGVDALISQITGFGVEKHDDLMDAFVMAASYCFDKVSNRSSIRLRK